MMSVPALAALLDLATLRSLPSRAVLVSLLDNLDSVAPGSAGLVALGRAGQQGEVTIEDLTIGVYVATCCGEYAACRYSSVVGPTFELDIGLVGPR